MLKTLGRLVDTARQGVLGEDAYSIANELILHKLPKAQDASARGQLLDRIEPLLPTIAKNNTTLFNSLSGHLLSQSIADVSERARVASMVASALPVISVLQPFESPKLALNLIGAHTVTLSPRDGFVCRQFILSPEFSGQRCMAVFRQGIGQQTAIAAGNWAGDTNALSEKIAGIRDERAPAAMFLRQIETVFGKTQLAVICKPDDVQPFEAAATTHRKGNSTWRNAMVKV